uniref:G-protein coupled receptors family 1 profile domain-containing protein n=1 Tax=Globodera rostochiensis TaxID=31243 RepID=A0A914GXC4_GLORO
MLINPQPLTAFGLAAAAAGRILCIRLHYKMWPNLDAAHFYGRIFSEKRPEPRVSPPGPFFGIFGTTRLFRAPPGSAGLRALRFFCSAARPFFGVVKFCYEMVDSLPISQQQIEAFVQAPPEKIASDYVELFSLIVLFVVGAPLNLAAWTQISERPVSSRLDILKKHLNYSDLLVLFVYVPSRACWLVTYDWRGGDFLCRFIKFMHTFAFQISSNVIVCIALDRLLSVLSASHRNPDQAARRMRLMLLVAWLTAALISLPQFAVWRSFQAFENPPWSQCMQMWEIQRAVAQRDATATASTTTLMHEESIYVIAHMMLIFWVPAFIILLCYVLLSCWVYVNSKPSLFELTTAGKSGAGGGVGIECAGAVHAAGDAPIRATIAAEMSEMNRCPRVSYQQITTMTALNDPSSDKPMIVINGQRAASPTNMMNSSPTPINGVQQQQQPQRNSSSTSNETQLLVSTIRHRQSSSYSAKSNRNRAIRFVDPELFSRHANKVYFLHGMIVFNSVINPYLYGLCGGLCRQRRRDS